MNGKQNQDLTLEEVDKLLAQQTTVILDAVDTRLENIKGEFKQRIKNLETKLT